MKRSTRKKAILLFGIAFALLLAGCTFFFIRRKDISYRISTEIQAAFAPSFELQKADVATTSIPLSELLADTRTVHDQSLMLINTEYLLSDGFNAAVSPYRDTDVLMNLCLQEQYAKMAEHVQEAFGEKLYIRSAYRTAIEQQVEAEDNAENATQVGASEHQAGLALDVYVPYYAGSAFLKTDVGRYVNENCHTFGFIVRYPAYGEKSTGIGFEPWHLRYVGFPHAEIISQNFLTLEEYIERLELGTIYRYGGYYITRQSGEIVKVPAEYDSAVISEDNTGAYILTFKMK